MTYEIHDGSPFIFPHEVYDYGIVEQYLELARTCACDSLKDSTASHAIYGLKLYKLDLHSPVSVEIYRPPVLLDDEEFRRRVDLIHLAYGSDICILALHKS